MRFWPLPPSKKTVDISQGYALYYISYEKRGVAQLAERLVRDQEAVRSSRITPTNCSARIASTVRASFLHRNARPLVYSILGPRPQAQRAPRPCVQVASLRPFIQPGSCQWSGLLFLRRHLLRASAFTNNAASSLQKPVFLLYLPAPICYNLGDFHECVSLYHFVLWNIAKKAKIYL